MFHRKQFWLELDSDDDDDGERMNFNVA